ncbi:MAG: group III truncated hemoglobin [Aestuariivirga sp.]
MHISNQDISELVDRFYEAARADDVLGPIFETHVGDWPSHIQKMNSFWLTVATGIPAYKGTPMQAHMSIGQLRPEHFAIWLKLFYETTAALFDAEKAHHFNTKAERIAESLKLGLNFRDNVLA